MRKTIIGLVGLSLTAAMAATVGGSATAAPPVGGGGSGKVSVQTSGPQKGGDERLSPLESNRRALRTKALDLVLTGERKVERINGSDVVRVGTKQAPYNRAERKRLKAGQKVKAREVDSYVELSLEQTDRVFVVLAEFGDERHPDYPDRDTDPLTEGPRTFEGPLHNQIPEPDRARDNRTIWQANYSRDYFEDVYFGTGKGVESLKTYYEKQSSGRYTVEGEVTDWVKVRYNEARYGRSTDDPEDANGDDPAVCADIVCDNSEALVTDAMEQWAEDQEAAGRTEAQIEADVASFDRQDRYDFDGDGNFNEPDGYVDRFQLLHAGGDEAGGDAQQGEDAIWSHRGYAFLGDAGVAGPGSNLAGGTEIGDTGLWVGDYTMQPENGGLSTIAHEYGHDLGLPDHYDAAEDNPVEWWTLMAQSRVRAKNDVGIGTRAADLGVWDKLQLGWLDYEVAVAGQKRTFELGPHEYNSKKAQALAVVLPPKKVDTPLPAPPEGANQWWSGRGDSLANTLTRQVSLGAGAASLTFQANWDIEDCGPTACDYAYVEVDDGAGWKTLPGTITSAAEGNGIDGTSDGWVPATFDLSAYAGATVRLRLRYSTDVAVNGNDDDALDSGLFVDDLRVTSGGATVFRDGAENGDNGWVATGFSRVGATLSLDYPQYYLASNRTYRSYDKYLKTGPYNAGFGASAPNKVEFFPYQTGLLVNYWDTSYTDNNTSQHPGNGLVLPVDAHPRVKYDLTGNPWRGRIQIYDAPFSRKRASSFTLHINGQPSYIRGAQAQPLFDDTRSYWDPALPSIGVKTPGAGVTLRVTKQKGTSMTVRLGRSTNVSTSATLASARRAASN